MGLLEAARDAAAGVISDQWKDFYTVPSRIGDTVAVCPAIERHVNMGRGTNSSGSPGVITNGSRIMVPEGYGLVLMQEGGITGYTHRPGAYVWLSDSPDSKSVLAGDSLKGVIGSSIERFKFGGRPRASQHAYFVSLKEIPGNRFGTPSEIYWEDSFLKTQVGALVRGMYTLRIIDPILFIRNFVPVQYLESKTPFDLADHRNAASRQLFTEVVSSLGQALAIHANDPARPSTMNKIQQGGADFAQSLGTAVERTYHWTESRGLKIVNAAIMGLEYDDNTRELLKTVQRADALSGTRGNANMQASVADALRAAGDNGASGIIGVAMASGALGSPALMQPAEPVAATSPLPAGSAVAEDPVAKLTQFKQLLDAGLITQADYDAAKAKVLGL